jgi:hypothetical protein
MHFLLISLLFLLRLPSTTSFLAYPFGTTDTIRNLTCYSMYNYTSATVHGGMYCVIFTAYFPNTTAVNVQDSIYSDVAFYQYSSNFNYAFISNNITYPMFAPDIGQPKKYGWLRMSRTRCSGFSNTIDVGYGSCTNLPYETFQNGTLCVCATNNCNINMATCINSANSYLPTTMIPLFSTFSNPISCFDDGNIITRGSTPYYLCHIYQGMFLGAVNMSLCNAYYATHSVVCSLTSNGADFRYAFTIEDYDSVQEYYWQMSLY